MVRTTFNRELSEFLARVFGEAELRRFISSYACLEVIKYDLVGKAESLNTLAHSIVDALCRRNAFTHDFFDALRHERGQRKDEVDRLEALVNTGGKGTNKLGKVHAIRITAPIGDYIPAISLDQVRAAISPGELVDDGFQVRLDYHDGQFVGLLNQLDGLVRPFLKHRVNPSGINKLVLFAFAPIPVLIAFGRVLGDKHPAEVFDYHRHSKSWCWDSKGPEIGFRCYRPLGGSQHREAALFLSISGDVVTDAQRVVESFGHGVDLYAISAPAPRPNLVRTRRQLGQFAELWQEVMAELRSRYERVHLFPATPLSVSVLCGCHLLPKADAELKIYDYRAGAFRSSLTLTQQEVASAL